MEEEENFNRPVLAHGVWDKLYIQGVVQTARKEAIAAAVEARRKEEKEKEEGIEECTFQPKTNRSYISNGAPPRGSVFDRMKSDVEKRKQTIVTHQPSAADDQSQRADSKTKKSAVAARDEGMNPVVAHHSFTKGLRNEKKLTAAEKREKEKAFEKLRKAPPPSIAKKLHPDVKTQKKKQEEKERQVMQVKCPFKPKVVFSESREDPEEVQKKEKSVAQMAKEAEARRQKKFREEQAEQMELRRLKQEEAERKAKWYADLKKNPKPPKIHHFEALKRKEDAEAARRAQEAETQHKEEQAAAVSHYEERGRRLEDERRKKRQQELLKGSPHAQEKDVFKRLQTPSPPANVARGLSYGERVGSNERRQSKSRTPTKKSSTANNKGVAKPLESPAAFGKENHLPPRSTESKISRWDQPTRAIEDHHDDHNVHRHQQNKGILLPAMSPQEIDSSLSPSPERFIIGGGGGDGHHHHYHPQQVQAYHQHHQELPPRLQTTLPAHDPGFYLPSNLPSEYTSVPRQQQQQQQHGSSSTPQQHRDPYAPSHHEAPRNLADGTVSPAEKPLEPQRMGGAAGAVSAKRRPQYAPPQRVEVFNSPLGADDERRNKQGGGVYQNQSTSSGRKSTPPRAPPGSSSTAMGGGGMSVRTAGGILLQYDLPNNNDWDSLDVSDW